MASSRDELPAHDSPVEGNQAESEAPREPMTERQARYLRKLCKRAGRDFEPDLSKRGAQALIAQLIGNPTPEQVRAVACPYCEADVGEPCYSMTYGQRNTAGPMLRLHPQRVSVVRDSQ